MALLYGRNSFFFSSSSELLITGKPDMFEDAAPYPGKYFIAAFTSSSWIPLITSDAISETVWASVPNVRSPMPVLLPDKTSATGARSRFNPYADIRLPMDLPAS
mgnify:CR=1 FL=1